MRKNRSKILFFVLLMMGVQSFAQKLTIDNVVSVTLRNSGVILANEQIKGYFFFYQSDKIDRKTNEYTLQLVDENLNKLKDIKFQDAKDVVLLESSFNGSSLVFLFYNSDTKTLEYRLYGMDGKQSFTYTKDLDKKTVRWMEQEKILNPSEEAENKRVFDLQDKGFLTITPIREDGNYTYDINFYGSGKRKTWTYNPIEDQKVTTAQYMGANDSVALIEVLSKKSRTSKDMESTLLGLNLETGKKVFELRTQDGKYQFYPMGVSNISSTGNNFVLTGSYTEGQEVADKTDGLGYWIVNNQGKLIKSRYTSWTKDLGKYLTVDEKGRVEDMGYVYIHKLIQTADGNIFAVGEGYKKVADGLGIAMAAMGSYRGVTKLSITNLLLIQMTPDFALKNAKIYTKNKNSFSLGGSSDFISPHFMASFAKAFGYFDYDFTQMGKDNASFMSTYTDYERSKDYKGLTFNSISYYEGKITTDKINLNTKATSMVVMPAKPGSVLVMEYFKKDKKIDFRMEKLN